MHSYAQRRNHPSLYQYAAMAIGLALCIFSLGSTAQAGAWTQPKGQKQAILTYSIYETNRYVDAQGNEQAQPTYHKSELNPYIEYGWRDDVTLGASAFINYVSQSDQENTGIGDTELFIRKQLVKKDNWVLSFQPLVKLPRVTQDSRFPVIGSTHTDLEGRILFGGNFSLLGRLHYIDAGLAYRKRFDTPSDQLRGDVTIGFQATDRIMLLGQVFHTEDLGSFSNSSGTITSFDDYRLTKLQLSGLYKLDEHRAIQAGAFTHLAPRNTGGGSGGMTSLWWTW